MGRAAGTVAVSQELHEELLAALDRMKASLAHVARARNADTQLLLKKSADDHEAMATLRDAGAAMSEDTSIRTNVHLVLASLTSLDMLAQSMDGVVDGGIQLDYAVPAACADKLNVSISMCGVAIEPTLAVQADYDAISSHREVATFDVGSVAGASGMAVDSSGSIMAAAYAKFTCFT